jgi:hypothetical protein
MYQIPPLLYIRPLLLLITLRELWPPVGLILKIYNVSFRGRTVMVIGIPISRILIFHMMYPLEFLNRLSFLIVTLVISPTYTILYFVMPMSCFLYLVVKKI